MDFQSAQKELTLVDNQLLELFIKRMELVDVIAYHNSSKGLPAFDRKAEEQLVATMTRKAGIFMADYALDFFEALVIISRRRYDDLLNDSSISNQ